jgi:hypothetical protein
LLKKNETMKADIEKDYCGRSTVFCRKGIGRLPALPLRQAGLIAATTAAWFVRT